MKKFSVLAMAAVCGSAFAFDISGGTGGGVIGDGTGSEVAGTPSVITLNVTGTGEIITGLSLAGALSLTHSFYGDLTLVLSHLGVSVDLMDRNYRTATGTFGGGGDLSGAYMFDNTLNGVAGSPGAMGTGATVAAGTYNRWNNPTAGSSTAASDFSAFNGLALDGIWTLTATDWAGADTGSLGTAGMRIVGTGVPEPATLAVLGLGAAALLRRRARK